MTYHLAARQVQATHQPAQPHDQPELSEAAADGVPHDEIGGLLPSELT
jgi:hypothetical protein